MQKKILLIASTLIVFSTCACKTIDSKSKSDLLPHVLKPIALISVKPPKKLKAEWPEIMKNIEIQLSGLPYLGRIIGFEEQNKKIDKDPKLRLELRTYKNTLSLTGISDKEIAWKLENELESKYFLFLEFLSFSCTKECTSNQQWLIRLKMIEVRSGEIIYWVRKKYELSEIEKNTESHKELAIKIVSEVINEFSSGFIVPWHRWRYFHLNPNPIKVDSI